VDGTGVGGGVGGVGGTGVGGGVGGVGGTGVGGVGGIGVGGAAVVDGFWPSAAGVVTIGLGVWVPGVVRPALGLKLSSEMIVREPAIPRHRRIAIMGST